MKKFAVKMMISSYKGARAYYDEALACEHPEARRVYKELAIGETAEFDKLCHLYQTEASQGGFKEHDYWLDHFKEEVTELRKKISENL